MSTTPAAESTPPAAPPTTPAPIAAEPSHWPTPIGVIAIVLGALGFLGGAANLLQPLILDFVAAAMPDQMKAQMDVTRRWMPTTMTLNAFQSLLALLLLVAGVMVLRRRPAGATLAVTWAILKMIVAVAASYVGYLVQGETMKAIAEAGQSPPGFAAFSGPLAILGLALGLLWGWAFPVFMLIWFARRPIRREVAAWQ